MGCVLPTEMRRLLITAIFIICISGSNASADFVNGSFESGDFTGWSRSGFFDPNGSPSVGGPNFGTFLAAQASSPVQPDTNSVVTTQVSAFDGNGPFASPSVGPTNGRFFAFISNQTSAGDGSLTGSSIAQTFSLPANAQTISFDLRLLSNEDSSFFASANDFGGIALTKGAAILHQFNIALNPASGADEHVIGNSLAGGFFDSTPWLSRSFDVSGLGSQTVTLTAYSLNFGGDNFVESRLLLDNVQVQIGSIPEPASLTLLTTGAVGLLVYAWLRRRKACL